MRWSIEELFKAWKIHTEFRFIYKVLKFPKNTWRRFRVLIHWIFKGYCKESLWGLDHTLMEIFIQKLTQFQKAGKYGLPMGMTEEEWDDILSRLIKGFKIMSDETISSDIPTVAMKLKDSDMTIGGIKSTGQSMTFTRYGKSDDITMQLHKKQYQYDKETMYLFTKYFRDLWD